MGFRELGNPALYINTIGIVSRGLRPWILDPEIRCRIRAGARRPLPASIVRGDLAIDEILHEPRLTLFPVNVQILS